MSLDQNDYNKAGMNVFVLSMIVTMVYMVYIAFFSGGIDLKEVAETDGAQGAPVEQAAPKQIDLTSVKEPWMPGDDMIAAGQGLYKTNCAMCHGAEGRGDGVAGASLNPKPRNLVEGKWKVGGDRLGLYAVLHDGIKGTSMQSYKASLKPVERWALVHYIRSITENKVADDDAKVAAKAPSLD